MKRLALTIGLACAAIFTYHSFNATAEESPELVQQGCTCYDPQEGTQLGVAPTYDKYGNFYGCNTKCDQGPVGPDI